MRKLSGGACAAMIGESSAANAAKPLMSPRRNRDRDPATSATAVSVRRGTKPAQSGRGGARAMVHLTFHGRNGMPAVRMRITDFRVTGGVLWDHLEYGMIASYCEGCWKHRGRHYPTVSVCGPCCLVFGTTRDPSLRSELIGLLSFDGPILRARGIAIARYREEHEMWFGLKRPLFWSAMR